jgi:sec-independent protein translocase protein TatC
MIGYARYAVLFIFILAAVLTPGPDIASQFLMAGPLLVLYVLSVGVAYVFAKERNRGEDAGENPQSPDG